MDRKSFLRTAAILYAEDNQFVSTKTIYRKIIESILLLNNNAELNLHQIIDEIDKKLGLTFEETEVMEIINSVKEDYFEIRADREGEQHYISLNPGRYSLLQKRERSNNIEFYIDEFITHHYLKINDFSLKDIIYKYIYELLNTNIRGFQKLLDPARKSEEIAIDSLKFMPEERNVINAFLNWDNDGKNKALFSLISYSIEYCLISNKVDGENIILKGVKNKVFYLDNNILYRAIGINGANRKKRILTFLKKCKDNGIKLKVSKFTIQEFKNTIEYNVNNLKRIPAKRIDPSIFHKFNYYKLYDYYHTWKNQNQFLGYEFFLASIMSEIEQFLKSLNIQKDYQIQYNEKDPKIVKKVSNYAKEIGSFKANSYEENNIIDGKNVYFLEQKRGENNYSIKDTKYFMISSDQKLINWDNERNDSQPILLLPSQWMGILLKYISRTSNDYKSFTSFINLKQDQTIISQETLYSVLAGISEVTEVFEQQDSVLEEMMNLKFEGIKDGASLEDIKEKSIQFAKAYFDEKLDALKLDHQEELDRFRASTEEALDTVQEVSHRESKRLEFAKKKFEMENDISTKEKILTNVRKTLKTLSVTKVIIDNEIQRKTRNYRFLVVVSVLLYYIGLICITIKVGWDTMEPITYFLGLLPLVLGIAYYLVYRNRLDKTTVIEQIENKIEIATYNKYKFDLAYYESVMEERKTLEQKLQNSSQIYKEFLAAHDTVESDHTTETFKNK